MGAKRKGRAAPESMPPMPIRQRIAELERELRAARTASARGAARTPSSVRIAVTFSPQMFARLRKLAADSDISISSLIAGYTADALSMERDA